MTSTTPLRDMTRSELLSVPERPWSTSESVYDSLVVWPSVHKHDSGWGCMTMVGCRDMKPVEVITRSSDDFKLSEGVWIDCLHHAKALHLWRHGWEFVVPHVLSFVYIGMRMKPHDQMP